MKFHQIQDRLSIIQSMGMEMRRNIETTRSQTLSIKFWLKLLNHSENGKTKKRIKFFSKKYPFYNWNSEYWNFVYFQLNLLKLIEYNWCFYAKNKTFSDTCCSERWLLWPRARKKKNKQELRRLSAISTTRTKNDSIRQFSHLTI